MPTKAQHDPGYLPIPKLLLQIRESAGLTQRELGDRLNKPQSWVYNCETGNRRVDIAEFSRWCDACATDPLHWFNEALIRSRPSASKRRRK